MFDSNVLFLVALLAIAGAIWYRSLAARERALATVRSICDELKLQPLDQTVTLSSLWPCRNAHGAVTLRLTYRFEFSTGGADRHDGMLEYIGATLAWIRLEHPDGPINIPYN